VKKVRIGQGSGYLIRHGLDHQAQNKEGEARIGQEDIKKAAIGLAIGSLRRWG